MPLPRVVTPTYELNLPSTGKKYKYRPFLVKEEKVLMMAMETDNEASMISALMDIIDNCVSGDIKVKELPTFDLEYIFLQLRARSISNIITVNLTRPEQLKNCCEKATDEDTCEISIDVDEIQIVQEDKLESKILLTDQIGVELKYPSTGMVQKLTGVGEMDTDTVFKLISKCIEQIWDKDEVYNAVDYSQKELDSFLESLTSEQFGKIRTFFEAIPKLQHEITWTCQHCSKTTKMMLEGLQSFFG